MAVDMASRALFWMPRNGKDVHRVWYLTQKKQITKRLSLMANQKTRRNRKLRGLPPNVPVERVKHVRWHTDTQNHVRIPSEDPDVFGVWSLLAVLGTTRKIPKPITHSMGAFNNAVLTQDVSADTICRVLNVFNKIPGECERCISARAFYVNEGAHVRPEWVRSSACKFCALSD